MNFTYDLRKQIIEKLKKSKIKFNKNDSTDRLLISYLNAVNRRIVPTPRNVFISDNIEKIIKNNKLNKEYIDALLKFKYNFENGIDMNGHLSANIYYSDLFIDRKKFDYRKSRDYLLDDWGIYHFHLNEKEAKNEKEMHGEIKGNRSEYLLFGKVTENEVYLIDVLNHNDKNVFAKQDLLKTLDRNWHFLLEKYMLPFASVSKFTDEEIQQARKSGKLILYQINGKTYSCIGGGVTTAGTNLMHTSIAYNVLSEIENIEKVLNNKYSNVKGLEFKLNLLYKGFIVEELNRHIIVAMHTW